MVAWLLVRHYLTDTVTALKLFRTEILRPLALECDGTFLCRGPEIRRAAGVSS